MSIDSWNSEGMDWSSASSLLAMPLLAPCEAVRKAIAERLFAVENVRLLASGSSSGFSVSSMASASYYGGYFGQDVDLRLASLGDFCAKVQQAVSALLGAGFIDKSQVLSSAAEIESSSYAGTAFSALPKATESAVLLALGNDAVRLQPDKLAPLGEWLFQQYRILNMLDALPVSTSGVAHDGGQRFTHEITPWDDEEDGDSSNMALGWAGLVNFDTDEYSAERWSYIYPASGKASAFGAVDIVSPWTRRQAWREWSQWTCNFGLLKNAGLDFTLLAMQAETAHSPGLSQSSPLTRQFSTEVFPRLGYCAMPLESQPDENGSLTLEFGNDEAVPEIPAEAPEDGALLLGWKLNSFGPFLAVFDFEFQASS